MRTDESFDGILFFAFLESSRLLPGGFWALSTTRSFGKRPSQKPPLTDDILDLLGRGICLPDGVTGMAPT